MKAARPGFPVALALAGLSACAALPPLPPLAPVDRPGAELERTVAVLFGARDFEAESDFDGAGEGEAGGIELVWGRRQEPLAFELALQGSAGSGRLEPAGEIEAETADLSFGLRYRFPDLWALRSYAAAGAAALYARTEAEPLGFPDEEREEWSGALYARAGIWAPIGDDLRLGFDARYVAEEWLHAGELDLDHGQLAATLGFGF